jgi:hypothetical protein
MESSFVRAQIQFYPEQLSQIRDLAGAAGVSVAEVVRRSVDYYIEQHAATGGARAARLQAAEVAGRYGSGRDDTSERHDDALAEVFGP